MFSTERLFLIVSAWKILTSLKLCTSWFCCLFCCESVSKFIAGYHKQHQYASEGTRYSGCPSNLIQKIDFVPILSIADRFILFLCEYNVFPLWNFSPLPFLLPLFLPLKDWPSSDTQASSSLLRESTGCSSGSPRITSGLAVSGKTPLPFYNQLKVTYVNHDSSTPQLLTLNEAHWVTTSSSNNELTRVIICFY